MAIEVQNARNVGQSFVRINREITQNWPFTNEKTKSKHKNEICGILSITWMNVTAYRSVFLALASFLVPECGLLFERLRY